MRYFPVVLLFPIASCAQPEQGKETIFFAPDGKTVLRKELTLNNQELADIEREKTRQVCNQQQGLIEGSILKAIKDNPFAIGMYAQSKVINNMASLMTTGKNYDPCPSSTNTQDAKIAKYEMWEGVSDDAFSFLGTGVLAYFGYKATDSLIGGLAGAAASSEFNFSGEGDYNFADSFNDTDVFGNSGGVGDWYNRNPNAETITDNSVVE